MFCCQPPFDDVQSHCPTATADGPEALVVDDQKKWVTGKELGVFFFACELHDERAQLVMEYASEWTEYTGVTFKRRLRPQDAEIRVSFGRKPKPNSAMYVEADDAPSWPGSGSGETDRRHHEEVVKSMETYDPLKYAQYVDSPKEMPYHLPSVKDGSPLEKMVHVMTNTVSSEDQASHWVTRLTNQSIARFSDDVEDTGAWSYVGTDALKIAKHEPTMNFGFEVYLSSRPPSDPFKRKQFRGTVLHEFGHALGFHHENPGAVPFNKDAVYKYYSETSKWSKEKVDRNLFKVEGRRLCAFDAKSIMSYRVQKKLLDLSNPEHEKFVHEKNYELSESDKKMARQVYLGS